MNVYAGGFKPGERLVYAGPLAIDGEVTVVPWDPDKWRDAGYVGSCEFRDGSVPVFSEKYPGTAVWWVSPAQLSRVADTCDCGKIEHGRHHADCPALRRDGETTPYRLYVGTLLEHLERLRPLNSGLAGLGSEWRMSAAKSAGTHICNLRTREFRYTDDDGFVVVPDLVIDSETGEIRRKGATP